MSEYVKLSEPFGQTCKSGNILDIGFEPHFAMNNPRGCLDVVFERSSSFWGHQPRDFRLNGLAGELNSDLASCDASNYDNT
jgi:hypothetical protein